MAEHEQDRLATIGGRMRAVRLAKGMTASDVAEKLDVSRPTITTWETDKVEKIDHNKLVDFANLADVSLKWLIAGVGKQPDLKLDINERAFVGKRRNVIEAMAHLNLPPEMRHPHLATLARLTQEEMRGVMRGMINTDPMIMGLLSHLPTAGSVWPKADRKRWLQLLEGSFDLIYKENEP
jgi:transcriptional regulator with XRE-family HTH domain